MGTVIGQTEQTAKKTHSDHGAQYFDFPISGCGFTEEEIKQIENSKKNQWLILPGEKYIRQAVVDGGDFWVFKCRTEIFNIISKYSLFEND